MRCSLCKKPIPVSEIPKAITTRRHPDGTEHFYGFDAPHDAVVDQDKPVGSIVKMSHHNCWWRWYKAATRPRQIVADREADPGYEEDKVTDWRPQTTLDL